MSKSKQIEDVAELACLKMDEEQVEAFQAHFDKILDYFEALEKLDTQGIEPMVTPHGITTPLRKDEVIQDLTLEEVLENAPDVKDSLFKVPPVV